MIVVLGGMVGLIAISVFGPVYQNRNQRARLERWSFPLSLKLLTLL